MRPRLDDPPREWMYGLRSDYRWLTVHGDFSAHSGDDPSVLRFSSLSAAQEHRKSIYSDVDVWAEAIGIFQAGRNVTREVTEGA